MQERINAMFIHPLLFFPLIILDLPPTHRHSRYSKYIASIFF